ncbi:MAG: hypothetical protein LBT25_07470 [Candidatus Symbiothrix sp.]|jgi:hypothetical protein|nr:hypothetical protein [Candidatus Symbiothrix sp.]
MKKIKLQFGKGISKKWISSFLSNLLGVIVGIALTFGISYLIQRHNEKKDTKELMTLIKKELNQNKQWLKERRQDYADDINAYRNILSAKNLRNIPADSLIKWINQTGTQPGSFNSTNAWDILKGTETIAKFHNKDLIMQLAECYYAINIAHEVMAMYHKEKENTCIKFAITNMALLDDFKIFPYDYIDALLKNKEIETFFTGTVKLNYYGIEKNFTLFEAIIDYTLYLIEKDENADKDVLDYNSFMKQKDNEAVKN